MMLVAAGSAADPTTFRQGVRAGLSPDLRNRRGRPVDGLLHVVGCGVPGDGRQEERGEEARLVRDRDVEATCAQTRRAFERTAVVRQRRAHALLVTAPAASSEDERHRDERERGAPCHADENRTSR